MRIDEFAILLILAVAVNVALLGALILPRLAARRAATVLNGAAPVGAPGGGEAMAGLPAGDQADLWPMATAAYERVVRVVSHLFIGASLLVVTVTGSAQQPLTYVLLILALFLVVLSQDMLPLSLLGRWRYSVEAGTAIAYVSLLIFLTGGHTSPFFFGYLLLLASSSLWQRETMPFVLALITGFAYLPAVHFAPGRPPIGPEGLGLIAFNLVALALISYVAAVIGSEQHRMREAALRQSRHDALTGLFNRRHFEIAVEAEVLRAQRTSRPFSLLMLDVDGLKSANDRYGHAAGDRLLRATAEAIAGAIRASDIAARFGGDEFVVILPDTDQEGALRVGEKLRFDVSRLHLRQDAEPLPSSVSIGLVTYPEDGRTSSELMRRVDLAMFEAKRRGKNQLVRFARQGENSQARGEGGPAGGAVGQAGPGQAWSPPGQPPAPWDPPGRR